MRLPLMVALTQGPPPSRSGIEPVWEPDLRDPSPLTLHVAKPADLTTRESALRGEVPSLALAETASPSLVEALLQSLLKTRHEGWRTPVFVARLVVIKQRRGLS